ncbi:MAG: hypothetical protein ACREGJ_04260 [Candidatus Saccharimonadales bacterium]
MEKVYIHAERVAKGGGEFQGFEFSGDLEQIIDGYEYGDVAEGNYQIWEYPSGKIFRVEPDREVGEKDYYTVPHTTKGIMWLPRLVEIDENRQMVESEYKRLTSLPVKKSLWQRVFKKKSS